MRSKLKNKTTKFAIYFFYLSLDSIAQRRKNAWVSKNVLGQKDLGMDSITWRSTQGSHLSKWQIQHWWKRSQWICWWEICYYTLYSGFYLTMITINHSLLLSSKMEHMGAVLIKMMKFHFEFLSQKHLFCAAPNFSPKNAFLIPVIVDQAQIKRKTLWILS